MVKIIYNIIKKIIFSVLFIYGYNIIASSLGYIIPINVFTVLIFTILGFPAFVSLIAIQIFIF